MEANETKRPTEMNVRPRIYIASLSDYNAGYLLGRWIDADQPVEALREEIAEMLAESRQPIAEEWAIHDYDNFGSLRLDEFEPLERVAEVAGLLRTRGPLFAELLSYLGGTSNLEEACRYMEEGYRGVFDSLGDYASDLVEECYSDALKHLPDFIRYHIDYDGIGHDMEMSGDIFAVRCQGKLHVFDGYL